MRDVIHSENTWEEAKEKIKETNLYISDADLQFETGHEEQMYEKLAEKLHKSKEEVKSWIESVSINAVIAG